MYETPGTAPQPKGTVSFRLWNIPVTIKPFFWLIALLFSPFFSGHATDSDSRVLLLGLCAWIAAWFLNFIINEMGHALAARGLFGASPKITLFGFGGVTTWQPYYSRVPGRWGNVLTPLAGPGTELAAAFLLVGILAYFHVSLQWGLTSFGPVPIPAVMVNLFASASNTPDSIYLPKATLEIFLNSFLWMGFFWGILNLLPILPLDGGHISRGFFAQIFPRGGERLAVWISMICAAFLAGYCITGKNYIMAVFFGFFAHLSWVELRKCSAPPSNFD